MMAGLIESTIKIEDLQKIGAKYDMETIAENALILAENLVGN
jgi:hypothetical protein